MKKKIILLIAITMIVSMIVSTSALAIPSAQKARDVNQIGEKDTLISAEMIAENKETIAQNTVNMLFENSSYFFEEFSPNSIFAAMSTITDLPKLFGFWERDYFKELQQTITIFTKHAIKQFDDPSFLEKLIAEAYAQNKSGIAVNSKIAAMQGITFLSKDQVLFQGMFKASVSENSLSITKITGEEIADITFAADPQQKDNLFITIFKKQTQEENATETIIHVIPQADGIQFVKSSEGEDDLVINLTFETPGTVRLSNPTSPEELKLMFDKDSYTVTLDTPTNDIALMMNPQTNELQLSTIPLSTETTEKPFAIKAEFPKQGKILALDVNGLEMELIFQPEQKQIDFISEGLQIDAQIRFVQAENAINVDMKTPDGSYSNFGSLYVDVENSLMSVSAMGMEFLSLQIDKANRTVHYNSMGTGETTLTEDDLVMLFAQPSPMHP